MEDIVRKKPHILLVEDDAGLAREITTRLKDSGYEVTHEAVGDKGLKRALDGHFDIMIMDRMLPEMDGLTILSQIRDNGISVPVLILSALSAVDDRINGLKAGGDDYLIKPFIMEELLARLEALLRRPVEQKRISILTLGPLKMDLIERIVYCNDKVVDLLPREFKLLEYMMRRPDIVLTRNMLLEDVWNYRFMPQTNLVDVHVGRLRRKLDEVCDFSLIKSIRGMGFCLSDKK